MSKTDTLLLKAQQYLRSAAVLLETGDHDSTASRAYFAMFYAAQAALQSEGLQSEGEQMPSGRGIRSAFIERFVRSGRFPERAEKALTHGYELQQLGDYSHRFAVSEEEAERALQEAEAFVNSITRLVRQTA